MEDRPSIDGDQLVASAVQYLIEGGEMDIAQLVLYCEAEHISVTREYQYPTPHLGLRVGVRGPRVLIDKLDDDTGWTYQSVYDAIKKTLPYGYDLDGLDVRASTHVPDENWRSDLQELIKGKGVSNQAPGADPSRLWQGFKFRSATEIKIEDQ